MGHFAASNESMQKVRKEFNNVCSENLTKDDLTLSKLDFLKKHATWQTSQDMPYLDHTLKEVLRVMPPVSNSTEFTLERDSTVGKYHIKAGDIVHVNITGLHRHPDQWQKPKEFRPERFDSTDPFYLTPSGKKRNTMSFCPFMSGKRACFGKTFAEATLKIMGIYMS